MNALLNQGRLPVTWRRGPEKWAPETKALAAIFAGEGMNCGEISDRLLGYGVIVDPGVIYRWIKPAYRRKRFKANRMTGSAEG